MHKKLIAVLLVFLLLVGGVAPSLALHLEPTEKLEREIRIIVELESNPIIAYATRKGIKVTDLDEDFRLEMKDQLWEEQREVQHEMQDLSFDFDIENEFMTVMNGFSAVLDLRDATELDRIRRIPGVQNVYIANRYERPKPDMISSVDMVRAKETWDLKHLKGEGMVVAVIDTGVDPSHKDMKLSKSYSAKLGEDDVAALDLPGRYYTEKVPYGYNYMDKNFEIRDLADDAPHGMHVTGTVGANGYLKGVAPECQILGMKVFSNDPKMASTWGDIYIKAIDDAIALGADAMNMSLGSPAGFQVGDDPEQEAIARAVENGVFMALAAGNEGWIGQGYDSKLRPENPDMGVVGAPGIAAESLSVASLENTQMNYIVATAYADGQALLDFPYNDGSTSHPFTEVFDGLVEAVYVQTGEPQYYEGIDMKGKIALVNRTGGFYYEKICLAAEAAGAAGVLVKPNPNHPDLTGINFGDHKPNIPFASLRHVDGEKLVKLAEEHQNVAFEFSGKKDFFPNLNAGRMSSFSSWGISPNFDLKPEITAPGGQIYSTYNDDNYGMMSGTSMATPHVAGGAALILQRIGKEFPEMNGAEKIVFAKNILMSTAKPHISKEGINDKYDLGNYTSPRQQGAGVMDLYAAAGTNAIVVDSKTGLSKVLMKRVGEYSDFKITIQNFGDEDITYDLSGQINTDGVLGGEKFMEPFQIIDEDTEERLNPEFSSRSITVKAHSEEHVTVGIDLRHAMTLEGKTLDETFENGAFVEGFVVLEPSDDNQPMLSIPYVGFYGDWDAQPAIDPFKEGFYGITGVYDVDFNDMIDEFAPDGSGKAKEARIAISFMRNIRNYEVNILNAQHEKVKALDFGEYIPKSHYGGKMKYAYRALDTWIWDGSIKGVVVPGQYYFQVRVQLNDSRGRWQEVELPIRVTGAGSIIDKPVDPQDPQDPVDPNKDQKPPYIEITKPDVFTVTGEEKINVEGFAWDESGIDRITINGQEPYVKYNEKEKKYEFFMSLKLEDGAQYIDVNAVDKAGNEYNFDRIIMVDTKAPIIENVDFKAGSIVAANVESVELSFDVKDNANELLVYVSDELIYKNLVDFTYIKDIKPIEQSFTEKIALNPGMNIITIKVVDMAGHETEIVVGKVYRRMFE